MNSMKKGFTLLELIIVIGIIAILGTVAILVLNPAQLFAQARDTTRISDLDTVNKALGLYMTNISSPVLNGGAAFTCTTNWGTSRSGGTPVKYFQAALAGGTSHAGVFAVDGTGWVAVALDDIENGSPIATLPRDPINDNDYQYQYSCGGTDNLFYELDAKMESTKYKNGGSGDKESTDGGDTSGAYEIGTMLTL